MSLKFRFAVPVVAAMLGAAAPTFAQNNGGGGQNGGGQNGGGGGGRANYQQQMMDRLKSDLGTTDDEFTAIQPKLEKVMQAARDSRVNPFGGRNRGRGGGGNGGDANGGGQPTPPESPLATAVADLKKVTDDKDAKPDDIKAKLEAVRAAKKAAMDDLAKAQEDLKSVLTQRQEAVLVERGMLD